MLNPVVLRPYSVILGHVYLQHASAEYVGSHNMRYHISKYNRLRELLNGTAFVYRWSLDVTKKEMNERNCYDADADAH